MAVILKLTDSQNYCFRILHKTIHKHARQPQDDEREPNNRLDVGEEWSAISSDRRPRRKSQIREVMAELVAYGWMADALGNPGPSGDGVVISGCEDGPVSHR